MQSRPLGPFTVSAIGLGCMSLSQAYGPPPPRDQAERVLKGALDAGYTFLDTAAVYGLGHNETLVGEVLGDRRAEFTLASKCGMTNDSDATVHSPHLKPIFLKVSRNGRIALSCFVVIVCPLAIKAVRIP